MVGVIGGSGVLSGDQFTRAHDARAAQNRSAAKQLFGSMGSLKPGVGGIGTEGFSMQGMMDFEAGVAQQTEMLGLDPETTKPMHL